MKDKKKSAKLLLELSLRYCQDWSGEILLDLIFKDLARFSRENYLIRKSQYRQS